MKPNISTTSHDALPPCKQHNKDKLLCKFDSMQMKTEMTPMLIPTDHSQCSTRSWGGWRTTGTQRLKIFLPCNLSALAAKFKWQQPPVSYSTITNGLSVTGLGCVSYHPLVLVMLNTIKLWLYIPIFCIFSNFMHFLYGPSQIPHKNDISKILHCNRYCDTFMWSPQTWKIGVLLYLGSTTAVRYLSQHLPARILETWQNNLTWGGIPWQHYPADHFWCCLFFVFSGMVMYVARLNHPVKLLPADPIQEPDNYKLHNLWKLNPRMQGC